MATNNSAFFYLIRTKLKATIRNLFRKPLRAILTIIAILFIGSIALSIFNTEPVETMGYLSSVIFSLIIGAFPLLMLVVFVFMSNTSLMNLNDANYLFKGPFSKNQIKSYLIYLSFAQMITISFLGVIYVGVFMNTFVPSGELFLKLFIYMCVTLYLTIMIYDFHYILNATIERKHPSIYILLAITVILFGTVLILALPSYQFSLFNINTFLQTILEHPLFVWVPFIGWAFAVQKNMLLIGFGFPFILSIVYTVLFYRYEGDFYEKAIEDAIRLSEVQSRMKSQGQNETIDSNVKKLTKINKFKFLPGGFALFSRQLLQSLKTRRFLQVSQLIYIIIYTILSLIIGEMEYYVLMLAISMLFVTNVESLESELNRHHIFLIPDHDFKKLVSSISVSLLQSLIYVFIGVVVLIVGFKQPILLSLLIGLVLFSVSFIYTAIICVVMRIVGLTKNQFVKMIIQMLLYFVTIIPSAIIVGVAFILFSLSIEMTGLLVLLLNTIIGTILLYSAKGITSGKGILD